MHRLALLALVLVAAGCGSASPPGTVAAHPVVLQTGSDVLGPEQDVVSITPTRTARVDSVSALPPRVLPALNRAYAALGIEVTLVDPAAGRIGNPRSVVRRTFAGAPLSDWVRCGETITGQRADRDRVTLSVVSTVSAVGSGSVVETRVSGGAVDVTSGTGGSGQPCTSTGALERRLHDAMRQALAP